MIRYIGDAKYGRLVGTDSLGNKYYENMNPSEEVPGEHSASIGGHCIAGVSAWTEEKLMEWWLCCVMVGLDHQVDRDG